jgi:predicted esterase
MRRRAMALLMLLLCALPAALRAQEPPNRLAPSEGSPDIIWHEANALFPVMVAVPQGFDSTRAYPAVVALHGFGSSSEAFRRIMAPLTDAGFLVILPEAPYTVPIQELGSHFSWGLHVASDPPLTDDAAVDFRSTELMVLEHIPAAVESVRQKYRLGQVFVLGFSQGATYAFLAGFYNADVFGGVISFGLAELEREWFTVSGGSLEDAQHLPVLLMHGTEDARAPIAVSNRALEMLQSAGYDVTLQPFQGGHTVNREQLLQVRDWLRTQVSEGR